MTEILWFAALSGCLLCVLAGPLGCVLVWRRMAFFSDALSHAALLGVVLSLLVHLPPMAGIIGCALLAAAGLQIWQRQSIIPADSLLGITAHTGLSLAMVVLVFSPSIRVDIMGYLFGDILALSRADVMTIALLATAGALLLWWRWRALMLTIIQPDVAQAEGVNVRGVQWLLMALLALVVALSIQLVGALLITAMMIIPAAAARCYARTPTHMALLATALGMISVLAGLAASAQFDTPSGPSIVLASVAVLLVSMALRRLEA